MVYRRSAAGHDSSSKNESYSPIYDANWETIINVDTEKITLTLKSGLPDCDSTDYKKSKGANKEISKNKCSRNFPQTVDYIYF